MGKAGTAGTSTGTNASASSISVQTHMGGTSSITIPGGYGGGDSSNYGVGGNLPTAPNMSDYIGYSSTYNGQTTVYACLCAYSVGGSGTTKASSHATKDKTSKVGNWTFYTDSIYAQFSKPAWYGVTFNQGSSQPNWGGAGGGWSSCGSGAKGQAGVGGSTTINTTTGYGAGGGGGGASQGTGGAGGKWWISIYY